MTELSPKHQAQIRRIIGVLNCPQDHPCHDAGFDNVGRVQPVGDSGIIECVEQRGASCKQGLSFGHTVFCLCPLRTYLAEHGIA